MRGRHHENDGVHEVTKREAECGVPLELVDRRHAHLRGRQDDSEAPEDKEDEQDVAFHGMNLQEEWLARAVRAVGMQGMVVRVSNHLPCTTRIVRSL